MKTIKERLNDLNAIYDEADYQRKLGNIKLAEKIANDASNILHQIELDRISIIENQSAK